MLVIIIICVCVLLILLVFIIKENQKEHRNVLYGGREFEVYLSPELSGAMCAVSINEVVHPNRKLLRTKYRCLKSFWISDYETIKEGVYAMIDKYLQDEKEDNLIEAKWNEVKENV